MTSVDDELARARLLKRLGELADELGIIGRTRDEMLADPRRAVPVLEHARAATGIKNPAAFAITLWRRSPARDAELAAAPTPEPVGPEHEAGPPDLDALEKAWALDTHALTTVDTHALTTGLLKLMAAAYTQYGGLYDGLRHNAAIRDRARG